MGIRNIVTFGNGGPVGIGLMGLEQEHQRLWSAIDQALGQQGNPIRKQFSEKIGVIKSFVGPNFVFNPQLDDNDYLVYRHIQFPNGLNLITEANSRDRSVQAFEFFVKPNFGFECDLALHTMLMELVCNKDYWESRTALAAASV